MSQAGGGGRGHRTQPGNAPSLGFDATSRPAPTAGQVNETLRELAAHDRDRKDIKRTGQKIPNRVFVVAIIATSKYPITMQK
jgi:hypothetical protein